MDPYEFGEDYGFAHETQQGVIVWMHRTAYGRCRFFDALGEPVGDVHVSVAEAVEFVVKEGWAPFRELAETDREKVRALAWRRTPETERSEGPPQRIRIGGRDQALATLGDRALLAHAGLRSPEPAALVKAERELPRAEPNKSKKTKREKTMKRNSIEPARQHPLGEPMAATLHRQGYIDVRNPDTGEQFRIREKVLRKADRVRTEPTRTYHVEQAGARKNEPRLLSESELQAWLSGLRPVLRATTMKRNERVDPRDVPHNINGVELHNEPRSNGARVSIISGSGGQRDADWFEVDLGPYGSALAKSNYRTLRDLLMEEHALGSSDDIVWAKGSGDSLIVKYGDLARSEREAIDAMSEYPALDDSDLSSEETEQQEEAWDNWAGREFEKKFVASVASEVEPALADRVESEGLPSDVDVGPLFRQALGDVQGEWSQESDGGWFIHRFEPAIERSVEIFMGREPARGSHVQAVIDGLRAAWGFNLNQNRPRARMRRNGPHGYALVSDKDGKILKIDKSRDYMERSWGVGRDLVELRRPHRVGDVIAYDHQGNEAMAPNGRRVAVERTMNRNQQSGIEVPDDDDDRILRDVDVDGYRLKTWDTYRTTGTGHFRKDLLGYALYRPDGKLLFVGEDVGNAPGDAIDSDAATRAIISFLTLKPGDTDADYFKDYTKEQMAFARGPAEFLSIYADEEDPPGLRAWTGSSSAGKETDFTIGFIEEVAERRWPSAKKIVVTEEGGKFYASVLFRSSPTGKPEKYEVLDVGAGTGFSNTGIDFSRER